MEIVVFGANGGSGRALVEAALSAGHGVRAVTRHPESFPHQREGLTVVEADARDAASVHHAIAGTDAVLSTLGTPFSRKPMDFYSVSIRCILDGMHRAGVGRLVAVTSALVDPQAARQGDFVIDRLVSPLVHRIGASVYEDMVRMEAAIVGSDAEWTIVRPAALANTDADAAPAYRTGLTAVRGRFTARTDLAAFMLDEAVNRRFSRRAAYIVSPSVRPNMVKTIWRDAIVKR